MVDGGFSYFYDQGQGFFNQAMSSEHNNKYTQVFKGDPTVNIASSDQIVQVIASFCLQSSNWVFRTGEQPSTKKVSARLRSQIEDKLSHISCMVQLLNHMSHILALLSQGR